MQPRKSIPNVKNWTLKSKQIKICLTWSNTLAQLPRLQATINARHFRLLHKTTVTPEVTPAHALSPLWMTSRWYCRKLLDDSGISRLSRLRAHVWRSQQVAPQDMILWPLAIQGQESGEQPRKVRTPTPRPVATSPRCSLSRDRRPTNQLSRACHVEQEGQDVWRQRETFVEWLRPFTTRLLHTCWTHFFNYSNLPLRQRFFAYLQTGYVEVLRISICRVCTGFYLYPTRHAHPHTHPPPDRCQTDNAFFSRFFLLSPWESTKKMDEYTVSR